MPVAGSEMQRLRDLKLGPFHVGLNRTRLHNGVCHAGFDRPAPCESLFADQFCDLSPNIVFKTAGPCQLRDLLELLTDSKDLPSSLSLP